MSDISTLLSLVNGVQRSIDISANTLVTTSIKVGGGVSNTELTKTILDHLVALQNGTDFSNGTNSHIHDGRYFTETELGSATSSSGSDLIGDDNTYSNSTPAAATVKGALSGIDTAIGLKANDNAVIKKNGSVTYTASQPMGGFKLTGLAAGSGAGDSVRYEQAILASGVNAFAANQSMGGFNLTNVADPSSAQHAATKAYVDALAQGLRPKQAVRVASTANVVIASALENGDIIDGITLATGDRVLLKDQTAPEENGIYVVVASGAASRSADFDSLTPNDEINGAYTAVQEGSANQGKLFVQTGTVAVLNTDPIVFVFFNSAAGIIGGDMITVTGTTISVDLASTSGLESSNPGNSSGQLRIKSDTSTANTIGTTITSNGAGTKFDSNSFSDSGSETLALASGVAGAGLALTTGVLSVNVDGSTLEINADTLRAKDAGITLAKLASLSVDENKLTASVAGAGLTGGAGAALAVGAGTGIQVNADSVDVLYSPLLKKTFNAGESFAADTSFLVRIAVNGETAGRVYKADKDASVSDKFYAIGVALKGSAVSAGNPIDVTLLGSHTLGASDTPFGGTDIGKAVYLTASGAFSITAPSSSNEAVYRIGIVEDTSKILVQGIQLNAIN